MKPPGAHVLSTRQEFGHDPLWWTLPTPSSHQIAIREGSVVYARQIIAGSNQ